MLSSLRLTIVMLATPSVHGCSNFIMNNDYKLSVRTMDLGPEPGLAFGILTVPRDSAMVGSAKAGASAVTKYGALQFIPVEGGVKVPRIATGGMNEHGLSCDMQTLIMTEYPNATNSPSDLGASYFCEWALGMCTTVAELKAAVLNGTITIHRDAITTDQHFVARDALGLSAVFEFIAGEPRVYDDFNDGGVTGWGVMTNEPTFDWQNENVRHFRWKQGLGREATTMPGTWYPDDRFLRVHLVKDGMRLPKSYPEAMMQAIHTLNTVTVPMGDQMGTDSGAGEGAGDHTMWGVVYDHKNVIVYFRTETNQNLQRLRLVDLALAAKATPVYLPFNNTLPWFVDAAKAMAPSRD